MKATDAIANPPAASVSRNWNVVDKIHRKFKYVNNQNRFVLQIQCVCVVTNFIRTVVSSAHVGREQLGRRGQALLSLGSSFLAVVFNKACFERRGAQKNTLRVSHAARCKALLPLCIGVTGEVIPPERLNFGCCTEYLGLAHLEEIVFAVKFLDQLEPLFDSQN